MINFPAIHGAGAGFVTGCWQCDCFLQREQWASIHNGTGMQLHEFGSALGSYKSANVFKEWKTRKQCKYVGGLIILPTFLLLCLFYL